MRMHVSGALHMLSPFVVVSVCSFVGEYLLDLAMKIPKLRTTVVSYVDHNKILKIPTSIHWLVRLYSWM